MSNKNEITRFIKEAIKQNISKAQIQYELSSRFEAKEFDKILKDFPEPGLKERYKLLNGILIACIVIVTLLKLLTIIVTGLEFGAVALLILLAIGVLLPIILIILLLSYRASAYMATAVLTTVSLTKSFEGTGELFSSGDAIWIGIFIFHLILVAVIIFLSVFLWQKIHPDYKFFSR